MLGTEGKFGFIEFRTIAEATSCIALNNIELGGKQLRIERPRDYAPMPDAMLDELRKQVNGHGEWRVAMGANWRREAARRQPPRK
eukprot:scaffold5362_cov100-Isochrysis_galbana.AAC.10